MHLVDTLQALEELREDIRSGHLESYSEYGICHNVCTRGGDDDDLRRYFHRWPKFSGNFGYPVPNPEDWGEGGTLPENAAEGAEDAYIRHCGRGTMYSEEYGALRLELLDFLIDAITEDMQP